jgi:hypothetical protein
LRPGSTASGPPEAVTIQQYPAGSAVGRAAEAVWGVRARWPGSRRHRMNGCSNLPFVANAAREH